MSDRIVALLGQAPDGLVAALLSQETAIGMGLLVSILVGIALGREAGFGRRQVAAILLLSYLGAVVAGRALDILSWPSSPWVRPIDILDPTIGGLSTLGGLVGAAAFAFIWVRLRRDVDVRLIDALTPVAGLTVFFFKLGCFLAGCCFGMRTDLGIGVRLPAFSPPYERQLQVGLLDGTEQLSLPVHPVQLYEAGWGLAVFSLLLAMRPQLSRTPGAALCLGAMLLLTGRFALEYLRDRAIWVLALGGMSTGQVLALVALVALGIAGAGTWLRNKGRRAHRGR